MPVPAVGQQHGGRHGQQAGIDDLDAAGPVDEPQTLEPGQGGQPVAQGEEKRACPEGQQGHGQQGRQQDGGQRVPGQQEADAAQGPAGEDAPFKKAVPHGGKRGAQRAAHRVQRVGGQFALGHLFFDVQQKTHVERQHVGMGVAVGAVVGRRLCLGFGIGIQVPQCRFQGEQQSQLLHAACRDGGVDAAASRKAGKGCPGGQHDGLAWLGGRFRGGERLRRGSAARTAPWRSSRGPSPGPGGPMMTVISPSSSSGSSCHFSRRPSINSSWVLVNSRHTATARGPSSSAAWARLSRRRSLRSKKMSEPGVRAKAESVARRPAASRGRKPRKV